MYSKGMVCRFYPDRPGLRRAMGELEATVMEQLWQGVEATAVEVWQQLEQPVGSGTPRKELAYSTVRTVMNRLVSKGIMDRLLALSRLIQNRRSRQGDSRQTR